MNVSGILAFIGSFIVILFTITYEQGALSFISVIRFFDLHAFVIVICGVLVCGFSAFPISQVKDSITALKYVFGNHPVKMIETIMVINDISKLARKNILGIEDALPGIENNMLRGVLRMILDRAERSLIQRVLAAEIAKQELEYNKMIAVHKFLALMAPGFGMTGTLIGMINLLRSLEDPSKVGPAMSVALVATLYGSVMGNIVFMPFALKITGYRDSVIALNKMIMEGVLLIEKTERPEHIEQALLSYFPADERVKYDNYKYGNA